MVTGLVDHTAIPILCATKHWIIHFYLTDIIRTRIIAHDGIQVTVEGCGSVRGVSTLGHRQCLAIPC